MLAAAPQPSVEVVLPLDHAGGRQVVPQVPRPLAELDSVMKLVSETEKQLSGKGRVLLRYSGTEPKIRLLIEGRDGDKIDKQADRIAEAIQSAIGA